VLKAIEEAGMAPPETSMGVRDEYDREIMEREWENEE